MEWIGAGDGRAVKLLRQTELDRETDYRLCDYTFLFSEDGSHLVRQTLTGQIARLTDGEWTALERFRTGAQGYAFVEEHGLTELARGRVLVEKDWDDPGRYESLIRILRSMSPEKPGVRNYVIFPTTGCNARCVYCFEEGLPVKTMTRSTADRLTEYIARTRWDDTVALQWFGGEPLCAPDTISYICRRLEEREIPFCSRIITNATLLTPALADEAKTLWRLTDAQISMDGAREDYEERKRFFRPDGTEYERALTAAELLLDRGVRVVLRINFDWGNLPRLRGFFDEMSRRFAGRKGFRVDPSPLNQTRFADPLSLIEEKEELLRALEERDLLGGETPARPFRVSLHQCMADSAGKQAVIDPEGTVFNCSTIPGPAPRGTIFHDDVPTDGTDSFASMAEECRHCRFLPLCTPNYRIGCPRWFDGCVELVSLQEKIRLRKLLAGRTAEAGEPPC